MYVLYENWDALNIVLLKATVYFDKVAIKNYIQPTFWRIFCDHTYGPVCKYLYLIVSSNHTLQYINYKSV